MSMNFNDYFNPKNFDDEPEDEGHVSRSQKKRDSTAAQKLGAALTALPKADLEKLDIPALLVDAILEWKKFPGHEAKRRQLQFIGRLMRDMDIADIEAKLESHLSPGRDEAKALHAVERLRDTLVNSDDKELETELAALAGRFPAAPLPRLRHLAVTAKNERAGKKPPKAYRELFRLLRDIMAEKAE